MGTTRGLRKTLAAVATGAALAGALSGCGSSATPARSLGQVLESISESQVVDVAVVRAAVGAEADTADEQLTVALRWEKSLPERPLPPLHNSWEELAEDAAAQLKSATCEAILDTVANQQVPNGQKFWEDYLSGLVSGRFPAAAEREIMADFDELYQEAEAGTLSATDIRFQLMKWRYCA